MTDRIYSSFTSILWNFLVANRDTKHSQFEVLAPYR